MSHQDLMNKIRYWDNKCARWMMRHFYVMFFEFVLAAFFFLFFFNVLKTIDLSSQISPNNMLEKLLLQQSYFMAMVIFLLILNSFWLLFMFNGVGRLRIILKEISYNLMRRK
ncbi:MAG: hypothetical protein KAR05_10725 [Candidatus Omnitrophica bacterium]|nr:hypothetical protein [Candidatus Omnitrophota bacterium]